MRSEPKKPEKKRGVQAGLVRSIKPSPTSLKRVTEQAGADVSVMKPAAQGLKESLEKFESYVRAQPTPMWGNVFRDNEEGKQTLDLDLSVMFRSLLDDAKRDKVFDKILSEIVLGAYQDRIVAYSISPGGLRADSTEAMETVQRIRHRADRHLLRVLEAFKEIKRPPVKVVVRQAEQVNVAEKQMNVDKQLNITSDLDKT